MVSVVSGDCGDCGDSLTVPSSWRPITVMGPATASGCGRVRVVLVKLGQKRGIQHIVPGHPGSSLPVNKIFQSTTPSPESKISCTLQTRGSSMISGGGGTAGSSDSVTEGETGLRSETWNTGWIWYRAGSWRRNVTSLICLSMVKGPI